MKFHHAKHGIKTGLFTLTLLLPLISQATQTNANNWTLCPYEVKTQNVDKIERTITVKTTKSIKVSVDCPAINQTLTFRPETMDYQSELAVKFFPKVGEKRTLVYRYLDGQCKDRGACRIQHYSLSKK